MPRRTKVTAAAIWLSSALVLLLYSPAMSQIERGGPAPTRTPIPPTPAPGTMPTPDRLAPPPTAASPTQADEGAQLFWLHCQPCHGDQGQGLTDEWRAQYPPEEQYCWESGCHGNQPYKEAFALPTRVPAVIEANAPPGEDLQVLAKFETMDAVYRYVSVAMPYFFPGDLTQEEYLAITAFLARENGLWDGETLTTANLGHYRLHPAAEAAPAATGGHLSAPDGAPATAASPVSGSQPNSFDVGLIGLLIVGAILIIGGVMLWRKHAR